MESYLPFNFFKHFIVFQNVLLIALVTTSFLSFLKMLLVTSFYLPEHVVSFLMWFWYSTMVSFSNILIMALGCILLGKDQALFCEGLCKGCLHSYCAGVSLVYFDNLSTSAHGGDYSTKQNESFADADFAFFPGIFVHSFNCVGRYSEWVALGN